MSKKVTMTKIMEEELLKIRNYPRWTYHGFAFPMEIDDVRERLRLSGVKYRTYAVYEGNKLKGYKVYVL